MSASSKVDIPQSVVRKLIFFTGAMITLPLATFFLSQSIFGISNVWAGLVAAIAANVVLIGYVITAFTEDLSPQEKEKKDQ